MATVTVLGASGSTVSLNYDTQANTLLATQLATAINSAVTSGILQPVSDASGPPPELPPGVIGDDRAQTVASIERIKRIAAKS